MRICGAGWLSTTDKGRGVRRKKDETIEDGGGD